MAAGCHARKQVHSRGILLTAFKHIAMLCSASSCSLLVSWLRPMIWPHMQMHLMRKTVAMLQDYCTAACVGLMQDLSIHVVTLYAHIFCLISIEIFVYVSLRLICC